MGIIREEEESCQRMEEFFRMLLLYAGGVHNTRKDQEEGTYRDRRQQVKKKKKKKTINGNDDVQQEKVVCVTSGLSFLGVAIVNQLLLRGYSVRVTVHNQEDVEKVRKMEMSGEMRGISNDIEAVVANLCEAESLSEAFDGCCAVFHTASFIDTAGLSGYSKYMAEIEVKASENVIKACAITPSVRNCVFTSSLLACTWQDNSLNNLSPVIDGDCWSNESLCIDKKLWYALGKTRAEKAAWRVAEEEGLKLATVCPALIIGPECCQRNPTSTIAYLKEAQQMYREGLLATVDVNRLAEAHVCVLEAMNKTPAAGRYICFDQVIENEDDVEKLVQKIETEINLVSENASVDFPTKFKLSNTKLARLMARTLRCNHEC